MAEQDSTNIIENLLSDAGKNLQQEFTIPTFKGVSTKKAEAEVQKTRGSRDELSSSVTEGKSVFKSATADAKAAIGAEGQARADRANADQLQSQEIADAHRMTNQLFGLGVNASDAIAVLANENTKIKPAMDKDLAEIEQMQSVGPLDDPIAWLFNGLQLPTRIQKYNTVAAKYNNNEAMIQNGIQNSAAMGTQLTKGIPTITAAQGKATADLAVAEANKLKAIADQNFAIHTVDLSNKKLAGDLAIAGDTLKLTQLDIEQAKIRYTSQIEAIKLAESHTDRLLKAASVYEKLDDIAKQKVVLGNAEDKLGYTRGTLTPSTLKLMKAEDRDSILAIGLSDTFGRNPYDVLKTVSKVKLGPGISEDTMKVINYIQGKAGIIKRQMDEIKDNSVPPEQKEAMFSAKLNNLIKADMEEAEKPGNFFHELSPAKFFMANKNLVDSPIGKILAPLASKDQEIMTKDIVATVVEGMGGNVSTAGGAISDYYKKNVELRNAAVPYRGAGGIEISNSYFVTLRGHRYDMTKSGDATKFAIVQTNEKALADMMRGSNGIFQ